MNYSDPALNNAGIASASDAWSHDTPGLLVGGKPAELVDFRAESSVTFSLIFPLNENFERKCV